MPKISRQRLFAKIAALGELVREDRDTIGELAGAVNRLEASLSRAEVRLNAQSDALAALGRDLIHHTGQEL